MWKRTGGGVGRKKKIDRRRGMMPRAGEGGRKEEERRMGMMDRKRGGRREEGNGGREL